MMRTLLASVRWAPLGVALGILPAGWVCAAEPTIEPAAPDAQPGLLRVGVAEPTPLAITTTAGYGYTEAIGDAGVGHRGTVSLAAALSPQEWLNVAANVRGRYDKHGSDSGGVIDGGLAARFQTALGDARLGAELEAWLPGADDAATTVKGASLDARALLAAHFGNAIVAGHAGYRLDRSAESAGNAALLAPGDRVALGLSDFDAVLAGLGGGIHFGDTELLLETSADVLIGAGAPGIAESPLRVSGGVRHALTRRLDAALLGDVSLSKRPDTAPTAPLVPIEPRFSLLASVTWRFTAEPESSRESEEHANEASPKPVVVPPPPKPTDAPIDIAITDDQGRPVSDAKVTLRDVPEALPGNADGHYKAEHVPAGTTEIAVGAAGYEPLTQPLTVAAGVPQTLTLKLTALPPPSQIRGVVRTYGGKPLAARIRVDPLGVDAATDASGAFQIDVAPGNYEVTIEADGFQTQRRKVTVEARGVVIVNADLTKGKP